MKATATKKKVHLDTTCVANECIAHRVRKINRVISNLYDTAIRHLGITVGQMNLLVQINELANANGVARPSELGPRLQMETSTLSRTLDRLRDKGFIDILRDDKDGRAQQLHLTDKAYELLRRGIAPWEKAQQKATQLLGSGGVALIHRIDEAIDAERAC
jgi:DNA-binding MarR family transcriptional regulator